MIGNKNVLKNKFFPKLPKNGFFFLTKKINLIHVLIFMEVHSKEKY